jgi:hypothetical protein
MAANNVPFLFGIINLLKLNKKAGGYLKKIALKLQKFVCSIKKDYSLRKRRNVAPK